MEKEGNILFCGVGGQGILLASDITSAALVKAGFDVKKSEVHGMAQRGGTVVAHLRYGAKVYSPLIEPGAADIEVAFELLESIRYLPYLKKGTKAIVNIQRILPVAVTTGVESYPEDVISQLEKRELAVFPVDALSIAQALGETRAVNMVLVGCLSAFLPISQEVYYELIDEKVPAKVRGVNREAFGKGRKLIVNGSESEK